MITDFNDPRVQIIYSILCEDSVPPDGEHWEGFVSIKIANGLFKDESLPVMQDEKYRRF